MAKKKRAPKRVKKTRKKIPGKKGRIFKKPKKLRKPKKKIAKKKGRLKKVKKSIRKPKKKKAAIKLPVVFSEKSKSQGSFPKESLHRVRMRVIGIGGGGASIVSEIAPRIKRVDFVAANTDLQALKGAAKECRPFPFGQDLTRGLGCGMDQRLGARAAQREKEKIAKLFKGIDFCVLVASLGGGTGSGAAPEFAKLAREMGVKTFGIFTLPFKFEGCKKMQAARNSIEKITPNLNALSIVPNEKIFTLIDKKTPIQDSFSQINKILAKSLEGLIETIYLPGLINIDFADLRTILEERGQLAYLHAAENQGFNRAEEAAKSVLRSPLNEYNIRGAERIMFNIKAGSDLGMKEVEHISRTISSFNQKAKIIFGLSQDQNFSNKIRITLLAVGCRKEPVQPVSGQFSSNPVSKVKNPNQNSNSKAKIKPKKNTQKTQVSASAGSKGKGGPRQNIQSKSKEKEYIFEKTPRRNALDLRKDIERTEEEIINQEKKWDIPTFLRRKLNNEGNNAGD
jgi:cell division protein FtsZ